MRSAFVIICCKRAVLFYDRKLEAFIYTILSNCYHLREASFFFNFKNKNHNFIKKVQTIAFLQRTILQCILQHTDIEIIFFNLRSLYSGNISISCAAMTT